MRVRRAPFLARQPDDADKPQALPCCRPEPFEPARLQAPQEFCRQLSKIAVAVLAAFLRLNRLRRVVAEQCLPGGAK